MIRVLRRRKPRRTKMKLQITLSCGTRKVRREATIVYPKKLYTFELQSELAGMFEGFKTMAEIARKSEDARRRALPYRRTVVRHLVRLHRPRKLKRR